MNAPRETPTFWTYEYLVLIGVTFFGFGNIAVFYGFTTHLKNLGIDPAWHGALLAAEPIAAVFVRPVLGLRLTPGNALATARLALVGVGAALLGYRFALTAESLLAVRIAHGLAFVCLVSAVVTLFSAVVKPENSGRAFSYYSLSSLLPQAIVPPLAERLLPVVGGEANLYAWGALCVLPALALLAPLGGKAGRRNGTDRAGERPCLAETLHNLRTPRTVLLLGVGFFVFVATNQVFFFMKPYLVQLGMSDPGLYFTVVTGATVAVRILLGKAFDKLPLCRSLALSLAGVAACLALFPLSPGVLALLGLAGLYGAGLGVAMPMLNAALFVGSAPKMRSANLNFLLFTMDCGLVLGPLLGGALLAAGAGYGVFFTACAGLAALAAALVLPLALRERIERTGGQI